MTDEKRIEALEELCVALHEQAEADQYYNVEWYDAYMPHGWKTLLRSIDSDAANKRVADRKAHIKAEREQLQKEAYARDPHGEGFAQAVRDAVEGDDD